MGHMIKHHKKYDSSLHERAHRQMPCARNTTPKTAHEASYFDDLGKIYIQCCRHTECDDGLFHIAVFCSSHDQYTELPLSTSSAGFYVYWGGGGGASPLNTPAKFPEGKVHIYDSYGALRHNFGYPSLEPPPIQNSRYNPDQVHPRRCLAQVQLFLRGLADSNKLYYMHQL